MIETLRNFGRPQPPSLAEREPQVELGHRQDFLWGQLKVSQAAMDAYGLVPLQQPEEQTSPRDAVRAREDLLDLTVWLISPDESAEYHKDTFDGDPLPTTGASLSEADHDVLIVSALQENRYAATQNILDEMVQELGMPDEVIREHMEVSLPSGRLPVEAAIDHAMPAAMLGRLVENIEPAAARTYTVHARAYYDRLLLNAVTRIGSLGLASAGVVLAPSLIEHGQAGPLSVGLATGAVATTMHLVRGVLKTHARKRSAVEKAMDIRSRQTAARICSDIVRAHHIPGFEVLKPETEK